MSHPIGAREWKREHDRYPEGYEDDAVEENTVIFQSDAIGEGLICGELKSPLSTQYCTAQIVGFFCP